MQLFGETADGNVDEVQAFYNPSFDKTFHIMLETH